jgi:hypothetical protein
MCVMAVAAATAAAWGAEGPKQPRVEARSSDLLAVGVVHDDKMTIHVSRTSDNAPVRDAVLTVVLRGVPHPTTAEVDGSYSLQTKDLTLAGAAALDIRVVQGASQEDLRGTLDIAAAGAAADESNSNRQLWWWVLNFAVCGAAFWLFTRRKAAKT